MQGECPERLEGRSQNCGIHTDQGFNGFEHCCSMRKTVAMVSIFMKNQGRNKAARRTEGIIRLLLIILWAMIVVVLGFYSGLAFHHH